MNVQEDKLLFRIVRTIEDISSPVLRSQLIMHISQLVDIIQLGETDKERNLELLREIDTLQEKLEQYENVT